MYIYNIYICIYVYIYIYIYYVYIYEKDLYNIVSSLKYRKLTDDFQEQMKEDIAYNLLSRCFHIFR